MVEGGYSRQARQAEGCGAGPGEGDQAAGAEAEQERQERGVVAAGARDGACLPEEEAEQAPNGGVTLSRLHPVSGFCRTASVTRVDRSVWFYASFFVWYYVIFCDILRFFVIFFVACCVYLCMCFFFLWWFAVCWIPFVVDLCLEEGCSRTGSSARMYREKNS